MISTNTLTRYGLVEAFREAGIENGDSLIVHSSYRSLGKVEGGPLTVIDGLLEVIGSSGNLMLPTFNYTKPLPEPFYDVNDTPCRTGIIPEFGRKKPGAIRSLHPTHSVAVIGSDACSLTDNHLNTRAFGVDSPIDRLAMCGGKILLLGVGQTSNSTIHVAEEHAGIPKPLDGCAPRAKIRLPKQTKIIEHSLDTSPSCSAAYEAAAYILRKYDEIRDARVGDCLMQVMNGKAVINRLMALLKAEPMALLCTNPRCLPCHATRLALRCRVTAI